MSYAGNSSLNEETKNRIKTTFGQTMQLAGAGRLQEASLGCDFILKMDAQFTPARQLLERLDGASGPIDVSDLQAALTGAAPQAPAAPAAPAVAAPAVTAPAPPANPSMSESLPPLPSTPNEPAAAAAAAPAVEAPLLGGAEGGELDLLDGPALGGEAEAPAAAPPTVTPPPASPSPSPAAPSNAAPSLDSPSLSGASLEPASAATAGAASSDDGRVQALLDEGQASFDAGSYQAAIDAWSRIFLIDIDHEEASQKIEEARRLKDETERALEERFFSAIDRIEAGDLVTGRALLEEVLQQQPDHHGAQERLRALDAAANAAVSDDGAMGDEGVDSVSGPVPADVLGGLSSESGMVHVDAPPEGAGAVGSSPFAQPAAPMKAGKKRGGGMFAERRFLLIGAGALLVVLGVVGFLWTNWDSLFPNRQPAAKEVTFNVPNPIADATRRHVAGDVQGAIDLLENVPENSARYQQAQDQIAEWKQLLEEAEAARVAEQAGFQTQLARREALLESARRLYADGEFFRAAKDFNAAAKIEALDGTTSELFEDAKRQLIPIQQQITLFREGEWERMQAPLWSILEAEPANRDARGLLVDSYYNIGVQALRSGSPDEAVDPLREADRLRPLDPMVERLLLLATSYSSRESVDPLYSIFVEELSYRK